MSNGAPKVLVIDDDPLLADLLAAIIEGTDCQTVMAADGNDALRLARTIRPALVFCDMSMPGMGGEEVIRILRADPSTAKLPVVLMSGHEPPNLRRAGADAFLAKPFSASSVLHLIRSLSASTTDAASESLVAA